MISIIIPAYNEEAVISKTISSVLDAIKQEPGEIIVVCNGCVDRTFDVASSFGDPVQVLNLEAGSKTAALNAGDSVAKFFPRFYLDADILVSPNAIKDIAAVLRSGVVHAAAPKMNCILDHSEWIVRAFYKTWLSRPYHKSGHVGSGFVAISEEGRRRFEKFPPIIADDEFLRRQFMLHERAVVENTWFTIRAPKDVASLIKVKTRSRLGTIQLNCLFPELAIKASISRDKISVVDFLNPRFWAYAWIVLNARLRSTAQWKAKKTSDWERDETSRNL